MTPFRLKINRLGHSPAARRGADTGSGGSIPAGAAAASPGTAAGHGTGQLRRLQAKTFAGIVFVRCRLDLQV